MGDRLQEFEGRLIREKRTGHQYLIEFEAAHSRDDGNPWPTKNRPPRQYTAFRLARALRANVPDIVIPPPEEAQVLARAMKQRGYSLVDEKNVYLERLTLDYRTTDPELFESDFKKVFTRNFAVAFWLRIADLHLGNLGRVADSKDLLMMFDYDWAFHKEYSSPLNFLHSLAANLLGVRMYGDTVMISRNHLLGSLDLQELSRAIGEISNWKPAEFEHELFDTLPPSLERDAGEIRSYLDYAVSRQKAIRMDFDRFFRALYKSDGLFLFHQADDGGLLGASLIMDKGPVLPLDQILQALSAAGAEESSFERRINDRLESLRVEAQQWLGVSIGYLGRPKEKLVGLADAFLNNPDPSAVKEKVRRLMGRINLQILRPLQQSDPGGFSPEMQELRELAMVLPVADDWLVLAYSAVTHGRKTYEKRTQALAVYSRRAAAEAWGRNGPHLRADFVPIDQDDVNTAPILLRAFLPEAQKRMERVQRLGKERASGRLKRKAEEYAGVLFSGLILPGENRARRPFEAYRRYFNGWAAESNGRLRPAIGLAVLVFPEKFPLEPARMPAFLRFAHQSFAHQEVAYIREFNRSRSGPPLTLWQLTTGTGATEEYIAYLEERGLKPLSRWPRLIKRVYAHVLEQAGVLLVTAGAEESGEALADEWAEFARETEGTLLKLHGERWTRFTQSWDSVGQKPIRPREERAALETMFFPKRFQTVAYISLHQGLKETEAHLRSGNLRGAWVWSLQSAGAAQHLRSEVQRVVDKTQSEEIQEVALAVGAGEVPVYQWELQLLEEKLEGWMDQLQEFAAGLEEQILEEKDLITGLPMTMPEIFHHWDNVAKPRSHALVDGKIVVLDASWIEREPRLQVLLDRIDQLPFYAERVIVVGTVPGKKRSSIRNMKSLDGVLEVLEDWERGYPFFSVSFLGPDDVAWEVRKIVANFKRASFDASVPTPARALLALMNGLSLPQDLAQELATGLEEMELLGTGT